MTDMKGVICFMQKGMFYVSDFMCYMQNDMCYVWDVMFCVQYNDASYSDGMTFLIQIWKAH